MVTVNYSGLLQLPVVTLPRVCHPTSNGSIRVFEPHLIELFKSLKSTYSNGLGAPFLHLLQPSSCPPALMAGGVVGGLPSVGCCAEVQRIIDLQDGQMQIEYVGTRRARLVAIQREAPFKMVAAEWFDDMPITESDVAVEDLEMELLGLLQRVCKLKAVLDPMGGASAVPLLPEAVQKYSPPPTRRLTSYDALKRSNYAAAGAIDMWRRHGSVYDKGQAKQRQHGSDPYQAVREVVGSRRRQELLSFAAAQMLDLGLPERLALLLSQDTGARLQYCLAAVKPHLQELEARQRSKRPWSEAGTPLHPSSCSNHLAGPVTRGGHVKE